jgi:hypothetical protein
MDEAISEEEPKFSKEKIIEALHNRLSAIRAISAAKCNDAFDQGISYMASLDVEWFEDLLNEIERT